MSFYVEAPPLIVGFDTETTGLDTNEDEIISYGFAVFRDGQYSPEESGQFFALTDRPIHPRALEVHGLNLDEIRSRTSAWGGPYSPAEGAAKAIRLLQDFRNERAHIVGAFPKFDFDMLGSMALRYGEYRFDWSSRINADFKIPDDEYHQLAMSRHQSRLMDAGERIRNATNRVEAQTTMRAQWRSSLKPLRWPEIIDVCAFDRNHWPDLSRRRNLSALCNYYGVQPGGHDSLGDARAAVEVWLQQIKKHQRQSEPGFLHEDL